MSMVQKGMSGQNPALGDRFEGMRHGSSRLGLRLYVASGAGMRSARRHLGDGDSWKKQAQELPTRCHAVLKERFVLAPLPAKLIEIGPLRAPLGGWKTGPKKIYCGWFVALSAACRSATNLATIARSRSPSAFLFSL